VRAAVVAEQAAALARQQGQDLLAKLQQGGDVKLPDTAIIGRASAQGTPREVVDAVLAAPTDKLPVPVGVDLGEQGYWVGSVTQVLPRDPALDAAQNLQAQYAQAVGNAEAQAYYNALKSRYKVEIKSSALAEPSSAPGASR
jgi:peptidyl-prolyl cis-trans isomerase D